MLFDTDPKENKVDLYDRSKEIASLSQSVELGERLVVIYGIRRVGKTSLIHVFLNERKVPYLFIDAKEIYFEHGYVPITTLHNLLLERFKDFVNMMGLEANIKEPDILKPSLTSLLKEISEWCERHKVKFAIVFDEAQYLRYGGSARYDGIIAWGVDNLKNIIFILTGSEAGVLKEFLRYDNYKAPLYGRFRNEIYLNKFDKNESVRFLSKGFEELDKKISTEELEDVVDDIGGIVGWLTYYGYYRAVKGLKQKEALQKVYEEGAKISITEIETLISRSRKRYVYILKAIQSGIGKWSDIKPYVIVKSGNISDTVLNSLLQALTKFGIIEKDADGSYKIIDPIVGYAIKKLKP